MAYWRNSYYELLLWRRPLIFLPGKRDSTDEVQIYVNWVLRNLRCAFLPLRAGNRFASCSYRSRRQIRRLEIGVLAYDNLEHHLDSGAIRVLLSADFQDETLGRVQDTNTQADRLDWDLGVRGCSSRLYTWSVVGRLRISLEQCCCYRVHNWRCSGNVCICLMGEIRPGETTFRSAAPLLRPELGCRHSHALVWC